MKLINDSNYVIAQNNVYLSFPVTNAINTKWGSSGWKVEASGNKLNIEPGQEVLLNVFMSDEFFKYNELICLDRPSIEIEGYLDEVDDMNQFHKGGGIQGFDSDFSSKLEDMKYGESTFEEQHIVLSDTNPPEQTTHCFLQASKNNDTVLSERQSINREATHCSSLV